MAGEDADELEAPETLAADVEPDATELASALECQTAILADAPSPLNTTPAWSQADEITDETDHRAPWRWAIGLAAAIVAVLGIVALGIGFGGWGLEQQRHRTQSQPLIEAPSPKPRVKFVPPPMPIGAYRVRAIPGSGVYGGGGSRSTLPLPTAETYENYQAPTCDESSCVLVDTPINPTPAQVAVKFVYRDGAWRCESPAFYGIKGYVHKLEDYLAQEPDGTWVDHLFETIVSAPPGGHIPVGATLAFQSVLTPIENAAN